MWTRTVIAVGCVWIVACGDSAGAPMGGSDDPNPGGPSPDEFCEMRAELECDAYIDCCGFPDTDAVRAICQVDRRDVSPDCSSHDDPEDFDGQIAQACLDATPSHYADCSLPTNDDPSREACSDVVLEDRKKAGEECDLRTLCRAGPGQFAPCLQGDDMLANVCGEPRSLPARGAPCGGLCQFGLRCRDGQCQELLASGETCKSDLECASGACQDDDTCGAEREINYYGYCDDLGAILQSQGLIPER